MEGTLDLSFDRLLVMMMINDARTHEYQIETCCCVPTTCFCLSCRQVTCICEQSVYLVRPAFSYTNLARVPNNNICLTNLLWQEERTVLFSTNSRPNLGLRVNQPRDQPKLGAVLLSKSASATPCTAPLIYPMTGAHLHTHIRTLFYDLTNNLKIY